MKMKDFVLLALLTALYSIVYFVAMMLISLMGPFGHAISPGVCGLLSGAILVFISRKIGKMWQFTLMELTEWQRNQPPLPMAQRTSKWSLRKTH